MLTKLQLERRKETILINRITYTSNVDSMQVSKTIKENSHNDETFDSAKKDRLLREMCIWEQFSAWFLGHNCVQSSLI